MFLVSKASVIELTSSTALSKGKLSVAADNEPIMLYVGLSWNLPSIVTSKPLSSITSFSYCKVCNAAFIFLALEPIGGDIWSAANTISPFSLANTGFSWYSINSLIVFLTVTATAPAKPDPRTIESTIPLAILAILFSSPLIFFSSYFSFSLSVAKSSSSSSNPGTKANNAFCKALNIKFCIAP